MLASVFSKQENPFFKKLLMQRTDFSKHCFAYEHFQKKENTFLKLHRPISALYSTVHVQCMYSACTVLVQCLYSALYIACTVQVRYIFRMLYGVNCLLCRDNGREAWLVLCRNQDVGDIEPPGGLSYEDDDYMYINHKLPIYFNV